MEVIPVTYRWLKDPSICHVTRVRVSATVIGQLKYLQENGLPAQALKISQGGPMLPPQSTLAECGINNSTGDIYFMTVPDLVPLKVHFSESEYVSEATLSVLLEEGEATRAGLANTLKELIGSDCRVVGVNCKEGPVEGEAIPPYALIEAEVVPPLRLIRYQWVENADVEHTTPVNLAATVTSQLEYLNDHGYPAASLKFNDKALPLNATLAECGIDRNSVVHFTTPSNLIGVFVDLEDEEGRTEHTINLLVPAKATIAHVSAALGKRLGNECRVRKATEKDADGKPIGAPPSELLPPDMVLPSPMPSLALHAPYDVLTLRWAENDRVKVTVKVRPTLTRVSHQIHTLQEDFGLPAKSLAIRKGGELSQLPEEALLASCLAAGQEFVFVTSPGLIPIGVHVIENEVVHGRDFYLLMSPGSKVEVLRRAVQRVAEVPVQLFAFKGDQDAWDCDNNVTGAAPGEPYKDEDRIDAGTKVVIASCIFSDMVSYLNWAMEKRQ